MTITAVILELELNPVIVYQKLLLMNSKDFLPYSQSYEFSYSAPPRTGRMTPSFISLIVVHFGVQVLIRSPHSTAIKYKAVRAY